MLRFMKGMVEGIYLYLNHEEFAMSVIGKYNRIKDRELLAETYRINGQRYLEKIPYPTIAGVRNIIEQLALKNPKAKQARPEQFIDSSLVAELEQSGFIRQVSGAGR